MNEILDLLKQAVAARVHGVFGRRRARPPAFHHRFLPLISFARPPWTPLHLRIVNRTMRAQGVPSPPPAAVTTSTMPSDDDDDSPTSTINRDTFVPPFTPLKRAQSLQSREPSIIDGWSEPPSPKDGYLGRWTASRLFSMSFSLLMAVVAIHATGTFDT